MGRELARTLESEVLPGSGPGRPGPADLSSPDHVTATVHMPGSPSDWTYDGVHG